MPNACSCCCLGAPLPLPNKAIGLNTTLSHCNGSNLMNAPALTTTELTEACSHTRTGCQWASSRGTGHSDGQRRATGGIPQRAHAWRRSAMQQARTRPCTLGCTASAACQWPSRTSQSRMDVAQCCKEAGCQYQQQQQQTECVSVVLTLRRNQQGKAAPKQTTNMYLYNPVVTSSWPS